MASDWSLRALSFVSNRVGYKIFVLGTLNGDFHFFVSYGQGRRQLWTIELFLITHARPKEDICCLDNACELSYLV